jgi:replication-associated recombination protein RarA
LLDKTDLFIADHPVRVESRVLDMIQLLDTSFSNDVLLLVMWGMGGIGKTTIAKFVYNKVGRKWFGSGSRIIITTRDKQIIRGDRVNQVYIMENG